MIRPYDVIIIGAGNAGAVLASRLTENPDLKVLVLEAGHDHSADPRVQVPTGGAGLWGDPKVDWHYETEPQTSYEGRSIIHPRGKGLGGTTLLNQNCLSFPDRHSIDAWGKLGNEGWSWDAMLPYYQKFHTFREPSDGLLEHLGLDYLNSELHGKCGPVQVSYGGFRNELDGTWTQTFANLGLKSEEDFLSGDSVGAQHAPGSIDPYSRTRSHAAAAYLTEEIKKRPNLRIITGAHVEKMLMRKGVEAGAPARVESIRYATSDGKVQYTQAAQEVVLCSGVFNSPQILELSGIGSTELLRKHNVKVVVDLPGVGENLQDHANVGISLETKSPTLDSLRDPASAQAAREEYQTRGTGPLSNGTFSVAYLPCVTGQSETAKTELAAMLDKHASNAAVSRGLQKQCDITRSIVEDPSKSSIQYIFAPVQLRPGQSSAVVSDEARQAQYVTLMASLSHPFSRGSCHIKSWNPSDPPAIDPRYFTHPADVAIETHHLQFLDTVKSTKPLADLLKPGGRTIPAGLDLEDAKSIRDLITTGYTTYHPSSTCSMLPREDGGVVDSRFRVYGVQGLRVVDSSVFPLIPRGNIQSSVYAIAERAADMLKEDWGTP